jgi:flagellar basal body-associated protein FliL
MDFNEASLSHDHLLDISSNEIHQPSQIRRKMIIIFIIIGLILFIFLATLGLIFLVTSQQQSSTNTINTSATTTKIRTISTSTKSNELKTPSK